MFPRDYPTITAGRTLLNCSPAQFDQYLDPTRYVPRTGAIEELATQLGYTCAEQEGLHTLHNAEGVRVIDGVRSRRAAYREWWRRRSRYPSCFSGRHGNSVSPSFYL